MDTSKGLRSKKFLSQFKNQEDVEAFISEFHVKIYEWILQKK